MYTIDFYSTILSASNTINTLYKKYNRLEDKINNTNYFINNIKRYGLNKQLVNSLKVFHNESNLNRLLDSIELTNTKNIATSKEVISILNNNLNIYKNDLSSLKESIYSTSKVLASTLSDTNSEVSSSLLYELTFNKNINTIIEVKNKLVNKLSCDISYESLVHISNEEYKEDQIEIANEGFKEVVSYVWEKIKKAFKWIIEKLTKLYNAVKSFIKKLFSKFTKKKEENTVVEKVGLEKLIEILKTKKYNIGTSGAVYSIIDLEKNIYNAIEKFAQENKLDELYTGNLIKYLFDSNIVSTGKLSKTEIDFITAESNDIGKYSFSDVLEEGFEPFDTIPKLDIINEQNVVNVYNRYHSAFQKYADELTDATSHIVRIMHHLHARKNPFINIKDSDLLGENTSILDKFTKIGNVISIAYTRINQYVQLNNIGWMKMFRDVLSSFEVVMGVKDNKRVEKEEIALVANILSNVKPAGTIDGFKWYLVEDLTKDMDKIDEGLTDKFTSMLGGEVVNAFCYSVPGLNNPIIITNKFMMSSFSSEEFKFILYHECGHGRNGHMVDLQAALLKSTVGLKLPSFKLLFAFISAGRNLHDELEADAYGIEHTSPDIAIKALNKLLDLTSNSKLDKFITKWTSDIHTRLKYVEKWKELGKQPPLPKRGW